MAGVNFGNDEEAAAAIYTALAALLAVDWC
jgi:hypothetical protein